MSLQIIFEDNHIIAVNKPAGVLVQGDETGDTPLVDLVKQYIKVKYNKPGDVFLGVVHRIDRPVSGAVIFARTSKALERMNKLFAERDVKKVYWAIVRERPNPESGTLTNYLAKDSEKNITRVLNGPSRRHPDAKLATLDYYLKGSLIGHHALEIHPQTGRSHQIRAQLAHIASPIRGDVKYGYPKANEDGSIDLHCYSMKFMHPVQNIEVEVTAMPLNVQVWRPFVPLLV